MIESPQQLRAEIQTLIDACGSSQAPSRAKLAARLRDLASRVALEFSSPEALKRYLKEHPKADPKHHSVSKGKGKPGGGGDAAVAKVERVVNDLASSNARDIGYNASSVDKLLKGLESQAGKKKHLKDFKLGLKRVQSEVDNAHEAASKMRDDIDKKLDEHADDMSQSQVDALEALSAKLNDKVLKPLYKAKKDQASSSMLGADPKKAVETSKASLKAMRDAAAFLKTL